MNEQYNTKEEAEKRADELNSLGLEERMEYMKFCPLTSNMCRKDCVCFVPARAEEKRYAHGFGAKSKIDFLVSGYCCENAMFHEYRTCYEG